ncbi:MAG: hypothetical protein U9N13_01565 [Euryarchaeota archaeon]|nr:hypothetical protein [Euryarchaeota archaeon]
MTVADTGVLIWLARYDRLHLLKSMYGIVEIPVSVFEEAVTAGKMNGYPDAQLIGSSVTDGDIVVRDTGVSEKINDLERTFGCRLGAGERGAITLALKTDQILLINDDEASSVANILDIRTKDALFILLNATKLELLEKNESLEMFRQMLEDGFWLAPDIAVDFERMLFQL